MYLSLIAALLLSLLMTIFAVQNAQQTQLSFMGWYFDGPLVIVVLLSFAAGALVAFLAILPGMLRRSIELSKQKTRLQACEQQLARHEQQAGQTVRQASAAASPPAGSADL